MFNKSIVLFILLLALTPPWAWGQVSSWKSVGMGGGGGQFGIGSSPADPNFMLAFCDMGGAYRSIDGGATWSMIDWRQCNSTAWQCATPCYAVFHPTNGNKAYKYGSQGLTQNVLLVTGDKGATWQPLTSHPPWSGGSVTINNICIDRGNPQVMFCAAPGTTTSPVYKSVDGGATWSAGVTVPGYIRGHGFLIDQTSPVSNRVCFAATGTNGGIYRSDDNGATWTAKNTGLPAGTGGVQSFAGGSTTSPANRIVIYCIPSADGKIYKSTDKGEHWVSAMGSGMMSGNQTEIVCSDVNPDVVYATNNANVGVYKSSDAGITWQEVFDSKITAGSGVGLGWLEYQWSWGLHLGWGGAFQNFNINAGDPNIVMGTNYGETFLTVDGGTTWRQAYTKYADASAPAKGKKWASIGMEVTAAYNYYINPLNRSLHYIAKSDIGMEMSEDSGTTWTIRTDGSPWTNCFYEMAFDPDSANIVYAAASNNHEIPTWIANTDAKAPGGVIRSADFGRTWTSVSSGLPLARAPDSSYCTSTSIVMDPVDKSLYVAMFGDGVYKSVDRGASWTRKSAGLVVGNNKHVFQLKRHADGTLFCLITARRVPSNTYPDRGGLFKSNDKGETWTNIATDLVWWPVKFDVHPSDSKILVIASMPSPHGPDGGVYRTTDGGAHWQQLTLPVNNPYAFAPVIDPANPSTVYVLTEGWGNFVSVNGGDLFTEFNGVPFWGARNITFDHAKQVMYVSTGGGGAFTCALSGNAVAVGSNGRAHGGRHLLRANGTRFTIANLPPRSVVRIFRSNGELVRELFAGDCGDASSVVWDTKGMSGLREPAGLYVYKIVSRNHEECGRIVVSR